MDLLIISFTPERITFDAYHANLYGQEEMEYYANKYIFKVSIARRKCIYAKISQFERKKI